MDKLTQALREWQMKNEISNVEMARKLSTSEQYVGKLISGKVNFGRNTASRWQEAFGFNADALVLRNADMLFAGNTIFTTSNKEAAAAEPQREVLTLDKSTVTEMLLTLTRAVDKQADIIQELRHQEIKKAGLPDSSQKVG